MTSNLVRLSHALAALYPDTASSERIMAEIGMDAGRILAEQKPGARWFKIVEEGDRAGLIPALLALALSEYPANAALLALSPSKSESPILLVAIGSDSALTIDLAALRAVRTISGMSFTRILYATLPLLKTALDRERRQGHKCYVHLAVHSSPAGVMLGGQIVDAVALSSILDGVQVLLIAGCEASEVGDLLGVVPFVITFSEAVSQRDAAAFTFEFWSQIGRGVAPESALTFALAHAPSSMQEYVIRNF